VVVRCLGRIVPAFAGRRRTAWEKFVDYVKWAAQEARRFKEEAEKR